MLRNVNTVISRCSLALVLTIIASPALATGITQFGVIFPTEFSMGSALPPGQGVGIQSIVVGNLGTTPFRLSDMQFTSSLVSTSTLVDPFVSTQINDRGIVLAPGQALGYINNDFNQPLDLLYVQSILPAITSLIVHPDLIIGFDNPLGSGVSFQNTQSTVAYGLSVEGASVNWMTVFNVGSPDLQPGWTAGSLGNGISASPVPLPSAGILFGTALIFFMFVRLQHRPMGWLTTDAASRRT